MVIVTERRLNGAKNEIAHYELFNVESVTTKLRQAMEDYVEIKNKSFKIKGSDDRIIITYDTVGSLDADYAADRIIEKCIREAKKYNDIVKNLNNTTKIVNKVNLTKYPLMDEIDIDSYSKELRCPFRR